MGNSLGALWLSYCCCAASAPPSSGPESPLLPRAKTRFTASIAKYLSNCTGEEKTPWEREANNWTASPENDVRGNKAKNSKKAPHKSLISFMKNMVGRFRRHPNPSPTHSRWEKKKCIGSGSFGQVYLGVNSENGQLCAIKEVQVVSNDNFSDKRLKQLNQVLVTRISSNWIRKLM
ncbi:mitogen-activated protein kinase kinase kinase 3-like [Phragmites australis]|uniref:mitogen-activated protein kinase kinase kinase 3-like n=1 Tax=Phragmites australis TaxID=29695 RepID=UPI002D78C0E3|nr:mitogen-activated protein kinase kinase kinase 3-like [Phragmites australis]